MAFTPVIIGRDIIGSKAMTYGTWATDTTGGNIDTGLHMCEFMFLIPNANASATEQCTVNETLPVAGSAVTIVVTSGVDGYWIAIGDMFA